MRYLMALLIALLVPTAAMAKGECKEDKQKFCKDVIEAQGEVGACLKQHAAELSEACKAAAMAKGECKEDKQKFCKDVIEAQGDVSACLRQHEAELSEACKGKLEAKEKKPGKEKKAEDSAKMGEEEGT